VGLRTVLFLAWPQFDAIEVRFWQQLRDTLQAHGLRLVLASGSTPPANLGVPHLRAPGRLDAIWPIAETPVGVPVSALGLDTIALLQREADWGEPAMVPAVDRGRRDGIERIASYWASILATLRPAVTVIWNGQHVPELILAALCRKGGCPVVFAERAPVPRALFIDDEGISAASRIAQSTVWQTSGASRWRAVAEQVAARMAGGGMTWWDQPAPAQHDLRRTLGIRPDQRVVMFAGQVDEDTQQFMFSPHFSSNLAAFRWLLGHLRGRSDVFLLGKHHPKSQCPAEVYRRELDASGIPGAWCHDVSIDDVLLTADRVAAVNSTVLYEALARGIPCLALGQWLIGGRGAAWELSSPEEGPAVIDAWLSVDGTAAAIRSERWRDSLAALLDSSIYAYERPVLTGGMRDAEDLAHRLAARAAGLPGWQAPDALVDAMLTTVDKRPAPWWIPWDHTWLDALQQRVFAQSTDWQRWQGMRETLKRTRDAVRRGRPLIVWGTGAAGLQAAALLSELSVEIAGFCRSYASPGEALLGRPVVSPHALRQVPRAFVLVASSAAADIVAQLETHGWCRSQDFEVVDAAGLAALPKDEASAAAATM
jgi:hypothetical protein